MSPTAASERVACVLPELAGAGLQALSPGHPAASRCAPHPAPRFRAVWGAQGQPPTSGCSTGKWTATGSRFQAGRHSSPTGAGQSWKGTLERQQNPHLQSSNITQSHKLHRAACENFFPNKKKKLEAGKFLKEINTTKLYGQNSVEHEFKADFTKSGSRWWPQPVSWTTWGKRVCHLPRRSLPSESQSARHVLAHVQQKGDGAQTQHLSLGLSLAYFLFYFETGFCCPGQA